MRRLGLSSSMHVRKSYGGGLLETDTGMGMNAIIMSLRRCNGCPDVGVMWIVIPYAVNADCPLGPPCDGIQVQLIRIL